MGKTYSDHPNTVGVYLPDFGVTVLVVYRPLSNSLEDNIALISYLESFSVGKELILVGDFNLPSIVWSSEVPYCTSSLDVRFLDLLSSLGLIQWVTQCTYIQSNNILDLVFTSEEVRISYIDLIDPFPGCDHFPVLFDYLLSSLNPYSDNVNNIFDFLKEITT